MALSVIVYTLEATRRDETPYPESDFSTQDYDEALAAAQDSHLMVIENTYEWQDSEPVSGADFTPEAQAGDEDEG